MEYSARLLFVVLVVVWSCSGTRPDHSGSLNVVAGENFWGSIAAQLGGSKAAVQSVVTDPNADPHEYESSANDARAFAAADLVILNGAGYDDWGQKLVDANPNSRRTVLNVAQSLGKRVGDNPHFWYDPGYVTRVADAITTDYKALDGADAGYFDEQRVALTLAFEPYLNRIAQVRATYGGLPVGATESIFVYLAAALGLEVISPPEFMDAVAEGNDPPASAVIVFQAQITGREIRVLVYNVQTATAVTTNAKELAATYGIPLVGISETMQPQTATFEGWQVAQLGALESALSGRA